MKFHYSALPILLLAKGVVGFQLLGGNNNIPASKALLYPRSSSHGPYLQTTRREMSSSADTAATQSSTTPATSTASTFTPDMTSYASGYSTVFEELPSRVCPPTVVGTIPKDLVGTYFRCGPAMFTAGSVPPPKLSPVQPKNKVVEDGVDADRMVSHPFEGDGAVLAVSFSNNNNNEEEEAPPTARFRYVRTAGFTNERKKGARMYKGMDGTRNSKSNNNNSNSIGNDVPLPLFRHHLQPGLNKNRKNTSNTRTIYWAKKLLTLWEGGLPYKLDCLALSTEGRSQLGGVLKTDTAFGSKGALDAKRDRMLFYDNRQDASSSTLTVYEFNSKFRLVNEQEGMTEVTLPGMALLSDFAVTDNYSVFIQPPIATNTMQYIMSKEPGKTLSLDSNGNALLHLIARVGSSKESKTITIPKDAGLSVETDIQFCNAYEEDGVVIVDLIRSNPTTQNSSPNTATKWPWVSSLSDYMKVSSSKSLWRYSIQTNNSGTITKTQLHDVQTSFGVINPAVSGQRHEYIYANVGALGSDVAPPQGITKFNLNDSSQQQTWFPEEYEFCGEPMFAPKRVDTSDNDSSSSTTEEDNGYILSTLYNGKRKESELIVLSAKDIAAGPIARIPLGMVVPHGHHGCFASSEEAGWTHDEIDRRARLNDKMEAKGSMWNEVKSDFSGLGLRLDDFEEYFGDIL